jgi:hypothetical protein
MNGRIYGPLLGKALSAEGRCLEADRPARFQPIRSCLGLISGIDPTVFPATAITEKRDTAVGRGQVR